MSTSRRSYILKVSEPMVMVPARIAALLERGTDISALRVRTRGIDPEASAVLEDIRIAAMSWSPDPDFASTQIGDDSQRKVAGCSEQWMTTGQVAQRWDSPRRRYGTQSAPAACGPPSKRATGSRSAERTSSSTEPRERDEERHDDDRHDRSDHGRGGEHPRWP